MIGIIHGCVPERHNRVADIFIDGTPTFMDDLGHRRQVGIHEPVAPDQKKEHSDSVAIFSLPGCARLVSHCLCLGAPADRDG